MPMPVVDPSPASPVDVRRGAPLLAHDASYFAASARIESFLRTSIVPHVYTVDPCRATGQKDDHAEATAAANPTDGVRRGKCENRNSPALFVSKRVPVPIHA